MKKIKILHDTPLSSFNSDWLSGIFNQYFDFEIWDPTRTYATNTLFYLNCLDPRSKQGQVQNFRMFIDNLWEVDPGPRPGAYRVTHPAWFWFNESLLYQHLGYDSYQPKRSFSHLALMPMNRRKPHRTSFLNNISLVLDNMIWSYVEQGRQLPNDGDMNDWSTQRQFNSEWYDQTYINMVVETLSRPGSKYTPIFITEKTMKPLAFQQPFLVHGNRGTLRTLREWGFVTFDNLWNEDYDEIVDYSNRQTAVETILKQLTIKDHNTETLQRIQHNRDRFFDRDLVIKKIVKEIIEPIIDYAETR
jgi:hypothetical protein